MAYKVEFRDVRNDKVRTAKVTGWNPRDAQDNATFNFARAWEVVERVLPWS